MTTDPGPSWASRLAAELPPLTGPEAASVARIAAALDAESAERDTGPDVGRVGAAAPPAGGGDHEAAPAQGSS